MDGDYSTRFRNRLTVERDLLVRNFRFTPYASAEFFYDFASGQWDEQQYEAGIQWPYRRIFMVETYYLFQHQIDAERRQCLRHHAEFLLRNGL